MALTKEQAINLINQNEDKGVRKTNLPTETLVGFLEKYEGQEWGGHQRTLRELDARIESCDFPAVIAKSVYETLFNREEIEYLMNL